MTREYAEPTPPKPDEPTGLAAVVEDADGNRWVNWRDPADPMEHSMPWVNWGDSYDCRDYADIDAVRVLAWGVDEQ